MARDGAVYVCQSCGSAQAKWSGRCPACGAWNSLVEEIQSRPPGALAPTRGARGRMGLEFETLEQTAATAPRIATGVVGFDRVCGGGVVPGSAILLGGDPGVGKSTLLLQVAANAARHGAALRPAVGGPARPHGGGAAVRDAPRLGGPGVARAARE